MSNFFHGKMFAKISELDETVEFDTADEFVVVKDQITQKISGLDLTESIVSIGNLASKAYVDAVVDGVVDGAPELLDTLNELAAALNDNENFATTITALINTKLPTANFGLEFWSALEGVTTFHIAESSNLYYTQARFDAALAAKTTTALAEGDNLYYTQARFDAALVAKTTTALAEGANLYFTEQRVLDIIAEQPTNRLANGILEVVLQSDGTVVLPADPTSDNHAATKGYVDNQITDVVAGQGFATLDYVEDAINAAMVIARTEISTEIDTAIDTARTAITAEISTAISSAVLDGGQIDGSSSGSGGSGGGSSGGVTSYNDLTDKPTLFQIGIKEPISAQSSATGVVDHDMATANIFNHSNLAGNFTCNVTNLSLPTNNAINVTLIVNQGTTPYMPTAFQIGGVAQTINWLNGITPAGSASKIDVASFSILNNSGTYTVLGSLSTFG